MPPLAAVSTVSAVAAASLPEAGPRREVVHQEALGWLAERGHLDNASVITSLPDVSELPALSFEAWCAWFENAALAALAATPDEGVTIFFQTDIRHAGLWVDKGALVARAAARATIPLLFHRIVCRKPPGTRTAGRASYSHLLAFGRKVRPSGRHPFADVIADGGFKPTTKSMGVNACLEACRFVLDETSTRTVVDPFCGAGTVLAVANALGLDAIGVDISARQCRRARTLALALP